jgi:hypothetical protein
LALLAASALCVCLVVPGLDAVASHVEGPWTVAAGVQVKTKKGEARPPYVAGSKSTLFGVTVTVEYADAAKRAEYLKAIDPDLADPFAPGPGGRPRALTFLVGFANDSKKIAVFQPGNVALLPDRGDRSFPIDMTDMYMSAERAGVEDLQPVIDHASRIMFDSSTTIPSGGQVTRLLAFRPIDGNWSQMQILFSYIQIGSETHSLSFPFHKEPLAP